MVPCYLALWWTDYATEMELHTSVCCRPCQLVLLFKTFWRLARCFQKKLGEVRFFKCKSPTCGSKTKWVRSSWWRRGCTALHPANKRSFWLAICQLRRDQTVPLMLRGAKLLWRTRLPDLLHTGFSIISARHCWTSSYTWLREPTEIGAVFDGELQALQDLEGILDLVTRRFGLASWFPLPVPLMRRMR